MIELSATADKLLEELKAKGVKLSFTGEKLRVQGELSDELKEQVRKNKEELIQLVKPIKRKPNLPIASNEPWVRDGWGFVIAHRHVIASHRSGFKAWWPFRTNPDLTPPGDTREDFEKRVVDKARKTKASK